jgi:hypothetical protein
MSKTPSKYTTEDATTSITQNKKVISVVVATYFLAGRRGKLYTTTNRKQ